jgi:hypothetical protein
VQASSAWLAASYFQILRSHTAGSVPRGNTSATAREAVGSASSSQHLPQTANKEVGEMVLPTMPGVSGQKSSYPDLCATARRRKDSGDATQGSDQQFLWIDPITLTASPQSKAVNPPVPIDPTQSFPSFSNLSESLSALTIG